MIMKQRKSLDAYYSPPSVTKWLLDNIPVCIEGTVLECASGDNAIVNPLRDIGLTVITNDINTNLDTDYHLDITKPDSYLELPKVDWIITNPPFTSVNQLLPLAFNHVNIGLALYVRKTITEPTFDRQDWLQDYQEHLAQIIFCPRVSFTGDGKLDNCSCDWLIWTKEKAPNTICTWVKRDKRKSKKK